MKRSFLIIGPSWVGDMIMSQVLYKLLKDLYPGCHIFVVAPAWSIAVLARMPEVDAYLELPFKHGDFSLYQRYKIGRSLRQHKFTHAIVLPNSWKSALIPFFANVPERTGFLGECRYGLLNDIRYLKQEQLPRMIDRFIALGLAKDTPLPKDLAQPKLEISKVNVTAVLKRMNIMLEHNRPILALCPGAAFGPAKRWPEKYFIELANRQIAAGWQIWFFGSNADKPVIKTITDKLTQPCRSFAGELSLLETIDLFSCVDALICNDSGLMHMGASLAIPLVAIYGSTTPKFTPPLSDNAVILEKQDLACRPCFKRKCPLKHFTCMQSITPDLVQNALLKVMA